METVYFLVVILITGIVVYFVSHRKGYLKGYVIGSSQKEKEMTADHVFLREENQRLKESLQYWSSIASGNLSLQQKIVESYNNNMNNTLSSIVGLLEFAKQDPSSRLSQEDRNKIDEMIERARGLS